MHDISSTARVPLSDHPSYPGMIWIPGGTFRMGSDRHYPGEAPAHRVTVSGFWIDRTQVTNRDFRKFVNATGYVTFAETPADAKDYPGALPHMLKAGSLRFHATKASGRSARLVPAHQFGHRDGTCRRHPSRLRSARAMLTFRSSITCAVMAFVVALAALLIGIQERALRWATKDAASAYMDATSAKAFGRLQMEIAAVASLVNVRATSSSIADSNERTETGRAIPLFKAVLQELPQTDSAYAGFENGAWLQVRRIGGLNEEQRAKLRAASGATITIKLIRPAPGGELPMRRFFEDQQGNEVGQLDLWRYGFDLRKRTWYRKTMKADRPLVSAPYLAFSIGTAVITVSAPLRGKVPSVLAADFKLDTFSDFVLAQRPGEHGIVVMFNLTGSLIAHPDFGRFVVDAMTRPSQSQLPNIQQINSEVVAAILKMSQGREHYEGSIRYRRRDYLFRVAKFTSGELYNATILLLAAQEDFAQDVRRLHFTGQILATIAGAASVPAVWMFGSGMSRSLKATTGEAVKLQTEPAPKPMVSRIKEVHELGSAMYLAHRAIWSFGHFVPKELVQRVVDNSISTELGGVREEITVVFTDVRDFTTIAGSADPGVLTHQTSRYFSVFTEAFLAEGGTIGKFIGDAVMVFWNAPNPQADVERACRAVLAAKLACETLNAQFEAEGLKPFFTRYGIDVGDAVVGNHGSSERMNYTALGNTVNLAARLEGLNKQFGIVILVSEAVYLRVRDCFRFKAFESVIAKGITRKTHVFELVGASA